MRLITYRNTQGDVRLGAWVDHDLLIVDLYDAARLRQSRIQAAFTSMLALIEFGPGALDEARRLVDGPPVEATCATAACTLLAPLPRPTQLRDFLSFPEHVKGCRITLGEWMIANAANAGQKRMELESSGFFNVPKDYYDLPAYYIANRMAVSGPEEMIVWPHYSRFIDYELEWAAVIGAEGYQISRDQASSHIFGYTILNDWSARDEQMKVMGGTISLGPGPGKDFANTLGPCIVTVDELPDPYCLQMTARVDGREVSRGNTGSMHYHFEELIEYLTRAHTIYPGEVLGSGTVGGGCSFETGVPISSGAVVELEVERIGRLRNKVVAPHLEGDSSNSRSGEMLDAMKRVMKA